MTAPRLQDRFLNRAQLTGHGRRELRADALAIAAAGLRAADPAAALERSLMLDGDRLVVGGQAIAGLDRREAAGETVIDLAGRHIFLVGAGKATIGMAAVLDRLLGARLTDAAVVVKRGQAASLERPLRHIEVLEASHPVPDDLSLAGGLRLLAVVRQAHPGDLLIGLVTGGSSALAVAPADGISLADKIETNRLLLSCGADIVSINNVRKHLSSVKGGLLARAFFEACRGARNGRAGEVPAGSSNGAAGEEIINFTVSDVVGDPLDYVTDLTVPDRSTWAMAQQTCERYELWGRLPLAVGERLRGADPAGETPKELPAVRTWILANAERMCAAAAEEARRRGFTSRLLGLDWEGEARDAGRALARLTLDEAPRTCLLAGGENTVVLANAATAGRPAAAGGPGQEAALAAAVALDGAAPSAVLCLDSDGSDGPTDAAGGLVDDLSAQAARAAGTDLPAALAAHASYDALASLGDLVVTGPTGTNVNDLKVALRS